MTRTSAAARHPRTVGPFLQRAARGIIDGTRTTLSDSTLDDTAVIHEIRKATKRWRALLRLLTFALGDESRRLRTSARDLAASLRRSRDAQSAIDALDDLIGHLPDGALPKGAAAAMRERLLAIRVDAESIQLGATDRARMAATLDAASAAISGWSLAGADFNDLAGALCKTYRRGLRLVPDDWQAADPEQLHELRQRTVELRHQLECVRPLLPGLSRQALAEPQRLRNQLGRHQDLTLLWPLVAPHQPLARWRSRLMPLIEARQRQHVAAAQRSAKRVFGQTPKAFRKRLVLLSQAAPEKTRD